MSPRAIRAVGRGAGRGPVTAATCSCMPASLRAVFTSRSSLRISRAKSAFAACLRWLLAGRWPSLVSPTSWAASSPARPPQRFRSKYILAVMYGSRALLIGWYLMAPKTEWTFYVFAVGLGLTWLATVPPTAAIVGKLFGIRYLATLFGLTLLSHQIGGFLGAYLGGIALQRIRQLPVDVVRGHGAGRGCRGGESSDSRAAYCRARSRNGVTPRLIAG